MLCNVDEKKLSKGKFLTKVRCFPGAKIGDMYRNLRPLLKKKPSHVLLHVSTNDSPVKSSGEILDELLALKHFVERELPTCTVIISQPIMRFDDGKANLTIRKLISKLEELKIQVMNNSNITYDHLSRKGLHMNARGSGRVAMNIISLMKRL